MARKTTTTKILLLATTALALMPTFGAMARAEGTPPEQPAAITAMTPDETAAAQPADEAGAIAAMRSEEPVAAEAMQAADAAATEPPYATQDGILTISTEAQAVLGHAAAARRALFGDDLEEAGRQVDLAMQALSEDEGTIDEKLVADATSDEPIYLPVSVSMSLSEGFTATRENLGALQRAYGLAQTARPDQAIEVLRLASVEGGVNAVLLPADESMTHLVEAKLAIDQGDVGAANRSLIAIGQGVVSRSFPFHAIPKQGVADLG